MNQVKGRQICWSCRNKRHKKDDLLEKQYASTLKADNRKAMQRCIWRAQIQTECWTRRLEVPDVMFSSGLISQTYLEDLSNKCKWIKKSIFCLCRKSLAHGSDIVKLMMVITARTRTMVCFYDVAYAIFPDEVEIWLTKIERANWKLILRKMRRVTLLFRGFPWWMLLPIVDITKGFGLYFEARETLSGHQEHRFRPELL